MLTMDHFSYVKAPTENYHLTAYFIEPFCRQVLKSTNEIPFISILLGWRKKSQKIY